MKKASGQWLESGEMDLGSIDQILQVRDRSVKCQELTPKTPQDHMTIVGVMNNVLA